MRRTQCCIYLSPDLRDGWRLVAGCTCAYPEVEMINNGELADGIDRYVIKVFNCGVLDDVTVDSNAQSHLRLILCVHFIFRDFTLIPNQVF